jgi:hypothetical protein
VRADGHGSVQHERWRQRRHPEGLLFLVASMVCAWVGDFSYGGLEPGRSASERRERIAIEHIAAAQLSFQSLRVARSSCDRAVRDSAAAEFQLATSQPSVAKSKLN